jgi:hypothetical protein
VRYSLVSILLYLFLLILWPGYGAIIGRAAAGARPVRCAWLYNSSADLLARYGAGAWRAAGRRRGASSRGIQRIVCGGDPLRGGNGGRGLQTPSYARGAGEGAARQNRTGLAACLRLAARHLVARELAAVNAVASVWRGGTLLERRPATWMAHGTTVAFVLFFLGRLVWLKLLKVNMPSGGERPRAGGCISRHVWLERRRASSLRWPHGESDAMRLRGASSAMRDSHQRTLSQQCTLLSILKHFWRHCWRQCSRTTLFYVTSFLLPSIPSRCASSENPVINGCSFCRAGTGGGRAIQTPRCKQRMPPQSSVLVG